MIVETEPEEHHQSRSGVLSRAGKMNPWSFGLNRPKSAGTSVASDNGEEHSDSRDPSSSRTCRVQKFSHSASVIRVDSRIRFGPRYTGCPSEEDRTAHMPSVARGKFFCAKESAATILFARPAFKATSTRVIERPESGVLASPRTP